MNRTTRLALGLLVAAVCMPAAVGQQFQVTDLGTLGGTFSRANSVNTSSVVAGGSNITGDAAQHAFRWTKKQGMQDLGTLPGGTNSNAQAVSSGYLGVIVGSSDFLDPVNGLVTHAFLYFKGSMMDPGTLGGTQAAANDVNYWGNVVGSSTTPSDFATHAFLWTAKMGMQDLETLGGPLANDFLNSQANGINKNNQVVGESDTASCTSVPPVVCTPSGFFHAFLWDSVHGMQDLHTLGGSFSVAAAINDAGRVVGSSSLSGDAVYDAFLYSNGTMTDLGNLGGSLAAATGIDPHGDIVGFSNTTGDADVHAFIYTKRRGLQDLNNLISPSSGWDLNNAYGVTSDYEGENLRIVGVGLLNGESHAFLLKPRDE